MHEINDDDFYQEYSRIEDSLKNATLIGLDSEFTGIKRLDVPNLSLFDSMSQRYKKLRDNIDLFIAIQVGLTTLKYVRNENKYVAETFSFYLLPKQLPFSDTEFLVQAGSLEFLVRHNFDFNKLYYNGISYLDDKKERELRKNLEHNNHSANLVMFDNYDDENLFASNMDKVYKWLRTSDKDSQSIEFECDNFIQRCYIQRELRYSFKNIWTEVKKNSILVIKVSPETRQALDEREASDKSLENQIVDYFLGFSKIFKLLTAIKKPIIVHNGFLDLMFMYKQFYKPLPKSYDKFKKEINKMFPVVYDTKFISYELKKIIDKDAFKNNILQELYKYFLHGKGRILTFKSPAVEYVEKSESGSEKYHDAGWDSYCSAYCFIKLAYAHALQKRNSSNSMPELMNSEIFYGIKDFKNCINIIQADLSHMKLDGPDPASTRPPWINISTNKLNLINIKEISEILTSFGPVAIKPQSKQCILVATSNFRTARDILEHFQRNKDYRVALYNPLRQSLMTKSLVWGGIVLSGGLLTWLIHDTLLKPAT